MGTLASVKEIDTSVDLRKAKRQMSTAGNLDAPDKYVMISKVTGS